jgi:hypothetical protein
MDVDLDHLSEKLTELPDGAMEGALCIIESDQPEAVSDSGEGGVEIDLTCLSHGTIRQLLAYVSRNVTTSATAGKKRVRWTSPGRSTPVSRARAIQGDSADLEDSDEIEGDSADLEDSDEGPQPSSRVTMGASIFGTGSDDEDSNDEDSHGEPQLEGTILPPPSLVRHLPSFGGGGVAPTAAAVGGAASLSAPAHLSLSPRLARAACRAAAHQQLGCAGLPLARVESSPRPPPPSPSVAPVFVSVLPIGSSSADAAPSAAATGTSSGTSATAAVERPERSLDHGGGVDATSGGDDVMGGGGADVTIGGIVEATSGGSIGMTSSGSVDATSGIATLPSTVRSWRCAMCGEGWFAVSGAEGGTSRGRCVWRVRGGWGGEGRHAVRRVGGR